MQNNKVVQKLRNYRKTMIHRLPDLRFLDDRPVFEEDRRKAEAFAKQVAEVLAEFSRADRSRPVLPGQSAPGEYFFEMLWTDS